jgi:hypothetical protein
MVPPEMLAHPMLVKRDNMQFNTHVTPRAKTRAQNELHHYFETSSVGIDVVEDGLKEMSFGEFLVDQGILDRYQLFRALQMQDRMPGVRLGECAAALGYAPISKIEKLYAQLTQISTVTVD